jgi:hypothetical protein
MKGSSLMGSHRTGKTTLAKDYADNHGLEFIPMSVSPAYQVCGISMGHVDFTDRMLIQDTALDMYVAKLEANDKPFITDRCFLDLLAYTIIDYPQNPSEPEAAWFLSYSYKCTALTAMYFDRVILMRPGIPLEACTTSWAADSGVVSQVDAGMLWAADQLDMVQYMPKTCIDHKDRMRHLEVFINAKL